MTDYQYIDSDDALAAACRGWQQAEFLALDSEFIRTDTYYPNAGLIQVGAQGGVALVDPLHITEWLPFTALLTDPAIVKVFHSCSEDLEVFQRLFGCVPTPLLDTQIGAAMAGYGAGLSYQRLVMACLDIHVEKGETRSDWLQRPLSENQCLYAALDVDYLQAIYPRLRSELQDRGRLNWWQEDCDKLVAQAENPPANEHYYLRVKSAWKLSRLQLALLQGLCEWREVQAQQRNLPRGWVLKDAACIEIARRQPGSTAELAALGEIPPKTVRRYGEVIVDMVKDYADCEERHWPAALDEPLAGADMTRYKRLKARVQTLAEQYGLPAELLMKKRDMEALLRHGALPASMQGWRQQLLQPSLGSLLVGEGAA